MKNEGTSISLLDSYLSKAREMQPVVGIEQVENLIKNAEALPKTNLSFKNKFNLKFKIVMSTSIIVIAACIISLFLNNGKTATKTLKHTGAIDNHIPGQNHIGNANGEGVTHTLSDSKKTLKYINLFDNQASLSINSTNNSLTDLPLANHSLSIPHAPQLITTADYVGAPKIHNAFSVMGNGIKPLELDKEYLSKMGFNTNTKILEYDAHILHAGHFHYYNDGSNDGTSLDNAPGLFNKTLNFYPAYITEIDGTIALNMDSIFHLNHKDPNNPYSNYAKAMTLLPVLFKQSDYNGLHGKEDIVFWFTVTPELKGILKDVKQELPIVQINRYESDYLQSHPRANQVPPYHPDNKTKEALAGQSKINILKALRLTDDQLKKIGFIITSDKIEYKCYVRSYGSFDYFTKPGGRSVSIDCYQAKSDTGQDFYPVFISDLNGEQQVKYRMSNKSGQGTGTEEYFLSRIRTLVPVLVPEKGLRFKKKKNLVFWFNITPSFLALLPDTVSDEMGKEYTKLLTNDTKSPDTTTIMPCKYFDVCQLPLQKEYGIKIYPNPASENINLEFWPPKNDGTVYCTFELTDLNGEVLEKNDIPWYGRTAGISVRKLKPGIYLVVYKLNTGEVITNKVMVAR